MNKFKPIMVNFNEEDYNNAQKVAKKKLELLDKASVWIHNQLDDTIKVNFKKMCHNMVHFFEDLILEFYKDKNQLGLSPKKLIEAKEINIQELHKIKFEYDNCLGDIIIKDNVPSIRLERKGFETWTTKESQNKKLIAGNKLISALNEFNKDNSLYHNWIIQGTGGYLRYDLRKNKYYVSNEVIFS